MPKPKLPQPCAVCGSPVEIGHDFEVTDDWLTAEKSWFHAECVGSEASGDSRGKGIR